MSDRRREIDDVRHQLAEADQRMLEILQQRSRLSRRARELGPKAPAATLPGRDPLEAVLALASDELSAAAVRGVFHQIYAATDQRDIPPTIAYVTPEGGSCQVAAQHKFGPHAQFIACSGTALALEEVQRRRAAVAVFAIESFAEGPLVSAIHDLAASDLSLVGKIDAAAQLHLMSATGELGRMQRVYAFPLDAIACAAELATYTDVTTVAALSPLDAAALARDDQHGAALVPEATGGAHGLVTARANVRDAAHPRVRYGVATVRPALRTGSDASAVLFGVQPTPGALFDVLKEFADRDIDLTCVHSCPLWEDGWRYRFYVEFMGHVTDRAVITALEGVKRKARSLRVLGSFPQGGAAP